MPTLNPYLQPIIETLKLLLDDMPKTNEHHLIKSLQLLNIPPFETFNLSNTKDLFCAHFLCMHALYHLKQHYENEERYSLVIESVRVHRIDYFSKKTHHSGVLEFLPNRTDPLENYYLNAKHYFETHEDEINQLLHSFWTKYLAQDHKQAALETLKLPANANREQIKKQYKRLAQLHHPDKGGCIEKFKAIQDAKSILDKA